MRRILLVLLLCTGLAAVAEGAVPCSVAGMSPDCYALLRPGIVEDALSITELDGAATSASEGQLLLTTVAVDQTVSWPDLLGAGGGDGVQRVERARYFPPDVDPAETERQFAVMMTESQTTAAIAALTELGYDLEPSGAEVRQLVPDAAADGLLRPGDVVVGVDGEPVDASDGLAAAVAERAPGDVLELRVRRGADGPIEMVDLELGEAPDRPGEPLAGVVLVTRVDLPVDVDISAGEIGGPSAGMVFALSVVDLLREDDLTDGRVIAGTGTIDRTGRVEAIGGVTQKVLGATGRQDGPAAEVFLVPRGNLAAAQAVPVDREVLLVPIDTLGDAVDALETLRDGGDPQGAVRIGEGGGLTAEPGQ